MNKLFYSFSSVASKIVSASFYLVLSLVMGVFWIAFSPFIFVETLMKKYLHPKAKAFKADAKLAFH